MIIMILPSELKPSKQVIIQDCRFNRKCYCSRNIEIDNAREMDFKKFFAERTDYRKNDFIRLTAKVYAQNSNAIPMAGGLPHPTNFPFNNLSFIYKDEVKTLSSAESIAAFQYGPTQGHMPLLEKWRSFQILWHNPPSNNWDVVMVPGAQDGFYKIIDMILNEGDAIMVQTPSYSGNLVALRAMRPEYLGIPQDADGIFPEEIERICDSRMKNNKTLPKALYVNPIAANPTGAMLTNDRKHEIYKLAQKYDFLIIEDDPYYFLHFLDEQPTSFLSIDTDGRVIRLDSFSKLVCPGIRLSSITAHREIVDKVIISMEANVLQASSLSQILICKLLEEWSKKGAFDNYIQQIKNSYILRRDIMIRGIEKHLSVISIDQLPGYREIQELQRTNVTNVDSVKFVEIHGIRYDLTTAIIIELGEDDVVFGDILSILIIQGLAEWTVPKGGMFVWMELKTVKNSKDFVLNKVIPIGLLVIPGSQFHYNDDEPDQHVRLCYSFVNEHDVDRGLEIFAKILRNEPSHDQLMAI